MTAYSYTITTDPNKTSFLAAFRIVGGRVALHPLGEELGHSRTLSDVDAVSEPATVVVIDPQELIGDPRNENWK